MRRRDLIAMLGGAAAAWLPLAVRSQDRPMPVIGYLSSNAPDDRPASLAAFKEGLGTTGYVEGRNVAFEYRWGRGHADSLPAFLAELVQRRVSVIVTSGGDWGALAKAATQTIPIVANFARDPVTSGLVKSIARPEGNLTGVSLFYVMLQAKRLEILHELVPSAKRIGYLTDPSYPLQDFGDLFAASHSLGLQITMLDARNVGELDAAFAKVASERLDALFLSSVPLNATIPFRDRVITLAAQNRIPVGYSEREQVAAGGLMSYGTNSLAVYRQLGVYTGRVLHGEKPSDLPILQPTTFNLVINPENREGARPHCAADPSGDRR